jgi:hypothetical protein
MNSFTKENVDYLLTPTAIRDTTKKIYDSALAGGTNFKVDLSKMDETRDLVMDVINDNYPTLEIPFHSRWGHFKVGDIDREKQLDEKLVGVDAMEIARTKLDLVITSVLLDAGAGKDWKFDEEGKSFNRSEGLAVASFHLFMNGAFSKTNGPVADDEGLLSFSNEALEKGFQVTGDNPLVGVDGRVNLLKRLGEAVYSNNEFFPKGRPGSIVDYLVTKHGNSFEVQDVLDAVLRGLGPIWPGRIMADNVNLGDVWHYSPLGELGMDSVVCFHKLSQWLTYSLVTPMIEAGLDITGAEKLTGLAEYRNGGLFFDMGVIQFRDEKNLEIAHKPSSDLVIEWRALTIQLLDQMGEMVQNKLNKTPDEFPLAKVLEGGTWWAGRRIAAQKRPDLSTPIKLDSDGTVF